MALRRRGGNECPEAFPDIYSQVDLANTVLFLAVFLGISVALPLVWKKSGAGKKLIGLPYIVALFFNVLYYVLRLIATLLLQCEPISEGRDGSDSSVTYSSNSLNIAETVFWYLAEWAQLCVVVYVLNTMLRSNVNAAAFKAIYILILGLTFAFTCATLGMTSYNTWVLIHPDYSPGLSFLNEEALWNQRLEIVTITYATVYLVSVLVSGALSLMAIFALRSRQQPAGDLLGWVIALIFSMVVWSVLSLVLDVIQFTANYWFFWTVSTVLVYLANFFQALSFIFLLCIAKHAAWNNTATDTIQLYTQHQPEHVPNAGSEQQQSAYGQRYYYQQAPPYNATPGQAK